MLDTNNLAMRSFLSFLILLAAPVASNVLVSRTVKEIGTDGGEPRPRSINSLIAYYSLAKREGGAGDLLCF